MAAHGGRRVSTSAHHSSHRRLITDSGPARERETVDAIIVPSARKAAALAEAGRLAEALGCTLLVLCSKHADALEAIAYLTRYPGIDLIAVDYPEAGVPKLPAMKTPSALGESRLKRRTDTSAKRNVGLVLARLAGWKRVVFLDDDIVVPEPTDLERAAALLDTRDGVGLHIGGFHDNSVVCHANRQTGAEQDTFIGGGALAVPTDRIDSLFPEIYNEDWFFLLGETMLRPVAQVGTALQKVYDPFADPARARREEFGDVLAEGLFALFDDGGKIGDADHRYWTMFLEARRALIEEIRARASRRDDILQSLAASSGRLRYITPENCVSYIEAWQRDRERWRGFMNGVRPIRSSLNGRKPIEAALDRLGWRGFTCETRESATAKRPPQPAAEVRAGRSPAPRRAPASR
ncbi:hypothetical protein ACQPZX_11400 [Actinoplanes sp. CA-142083]|uniref:hypothetical protein n=1 Tax=Actinoplanes sp. CA-142083 TaxID=3239903 RepID=UPI003D8A776E